MDYYRQATDYTHSLNGELPPGMEQIRKYGEENKIPTVSQEVGEFLQLQCMIKAPRTLLEIGCGISFSTHWMIMGATEAKCIAIDTNKQRLTMAETFLKESGLLDQVTLLNTSGEEFLAHTREHFDFIFIDSIKKDYIKLLQPAYNQLNRKGLLIVDNMFYNGKILNLKPEDKKKYTDGVQQMRQFHHTVATFTGLKSIFLALGDGLLVSQKMV